MKILILNPPSKVTRNVVRDLPYGCWCKGKRIGGTKFPPTSLLYVATVLRENGHRVRLLDAGGEKKPIWEVKKEIGDYRVVIISTSTMTFNEDTQVLAELKEENNRLTTIVFGSHPTFMPRYSLAKHAVDIIVQREPEYIIRDLVAALEKKDDSWKRIRGIGFRENGKVIINPPYPFIENLDELPFPDRGMLPKDIDYFNPVVKRLPYTTAMSSRGCPVECIFCISPFFYGKKVRYRSWKNVIAELELIQNQGYREVFFRDETFTFNKERNIRICQEIIKRKIDLTWVCNARVGTVDKEMMKLMKKAGCHMIKFGVESGVQEILNNLKKGIRVEMTRKTFKWAHEVGMETHAHVMLGSPGESKETIEETIKFVKEIAPTTATFGICTPYPGTELFSRVVQRYPEIEDGSACDLRRLHTKGFFNETFTYLTKEELEKSIIRAYRKFYFHPSYLFRSLKRIESKDELKRLILAGTNIFIFSLKGE
ncbi:radical SAM protein [bacterium]|nr:radical SAM protein [bacterium]